MSQNITLNDTAYTGITKIKALKTGSSDYAEFVDTSDADAVASNIDSGKKAYVNGSLVTGTSTKVDTSDADATASEIASGKTAYVNGSKITGTHSCSASPTLQEKTVTANGEVTPDSGYDGLSKVTVNVPSSGGGDVTITNYTITEDTDKALWLNAQNIQLVKGINILVSEKFLYNESQTYNQGAISLMYLQWDGEPATVSTSVSTVASKCHLRGGGMVCSQYNLLGAANAINSGNTTAASVASDGTLTCTTTATGVTTGNYNNSYFEVGTYYLVQIPSDTIC